jgi:hypothetical protein
MVKKANKPFELKCFKDIQSKNYIHSFHQSNHGHLMIAGDFTTHIDYLLDSILKRIPLTYTQQDIKLVMYSKTYVIHEHSPLNKYLKTSIFETSETLLSKLKWLKKTMNNRYKTFNEYKAKDIFTFNGKVMNKEINKRWIPYLFVVIHEFPQKSDSNSDAIHDLMHTITLKSRASGIHILLTSSMIMESINPIFKYNMDGIYFKVESIESSHLLNGYNAVYELNTNQVIVRDSLSRYCNKYTLFEEPKKRILLHSLNN